LAGAVVVEVDEQVDDVELVEIEPVDTVEPVESVESVDPVVHTNGHATQAVGSGADGAGWSS